MLLEYLRVSAGGVLRLLVWCLQLGVWAVVLLQAKGLIEGAALVLLQVLPRFYLVSPRFYHSMGGAWDGSGRAGGSRALGRADFLNPQNMIRDT